MAGCFINPSGSLAKDIFTKPTMTVNPGRGISITDEAALDKMIKNSGGDFKNLVTEAVTAYKRNPYGWVLYTISSYGCPYKTWIANIQFGTGYCYDSPTVTSVVSMVCRDSINRNIPCPNKGNTSGHTPISVTGCPAGYSIDRYNATSTNCEGGTTCTSTIKFFCRKN